MTDPKLKTIRGIIFASDPKKKPIHRTRVLGEMDLPRWGGSLYFRNARLEEAGHLKHLYEDAWNDDHTKSKPITITEEQIRSCIKNFPEGQIVGCEKPKKGQKADGIPVSMINIMLTSFDPEKWFSGGYEAVTGNRTFSTSVDPKRLFELAEARDEILPVAFCVSIAVPKQFQTKRYAFQTLKYAVIFSEFNGLIPAPYSAPRGFAGAREENPSLDIYDYLRMTIKMPNKKKHTLSELHANYEGKVLAISDRLFGAFPEGSISPIDIFIKYQREPSDTPHTPAGNRAFDKFSNEDKSRLEEQYGRILTIEDFCIMTGRFLYDPIIGMHIAYGARFIRDENGSIIAVFRDSRPEDLAACGYNIILSYGYHPLLGHKFASEVERNDKEHNRSRETDRVPNDM